MQTNLQSITIELTDDQVAALAKSYHLPLKPDGKPYGKDVVDQVRARAFRVLSESTLMTEIGTVTTGARPRTSFR